MAMSGPDLIFDWNTAPVIPGSKIVVVVVVEGKTKVKQYTGKRWKRCVSRGSSLNNLNVVSGR